MTLIIYSLNLDNQEANIILNIQLRKDMNSRDIHAPSADDDHEWHEIKQTTPLPPHSYDTP
jgi:hypothetical protein